METDYEIAIQVLRKMADPIETWSSEEGERDISRICPKCGKFVEYLPYYQGTYCTSCDWYVKYNYEIDGDYMKEKEKI